MLSHQRRPDDLEFSGATFRSVADISDPNKYTYITDAQIYGDATLYVIRESSSDGLHLAEVITSSEAHAWQASCKPGSAAPTTAWS